MKMEKFYTSGPKSSNSTQYLSAILIDSKSQPLTTNQRGCNFWRRGELAMNKNGLLIKIVFGLCCFVFLLTLFDFLALHDIRNEYISTRILNHLNLTVSGDLPDWTATKGEWDIVYVSFLSRVVFFVLNIFVLYICLKKSRKESL